MENEDVRQSLQQRAAESGHNVQLRSTGDEELDPGNIGNRLTHHEEDGRFWVFILAFVEGVDDNHGRNICGPERLDEKLFHLISKGLVDDVWIGLEERDEGGPEFGVLLCKLKRQCGEDKLQIVAFFNASRAEEWGAQTAVGEQPLRDGLRDCGLSRPGESVEPEDGRLFEVLTVQRSILSNTLSLVPLKQPFRFPCRYPAPYARRQLFKTKSSALKHMS